MGEWVKMLKSVMNVMFKKRETSSYLFEITVDCVLVPLSPLSAFVFFGCYLI